MFQENSPCTFYFNNAADETSKSDQKSIGFKDHYGELKGNFEISNAICIQKFQQPIKLPTGFYGISLNLL